MTFRNVYPAGRSVACLLTCCFPIRSASGHQVLLPPQCHRRHLTFRSTSGLFKVISNLSGSCKWGRLTPSCWASPQPSWEAQGGWGPLLLQSSGIKNQQPWNLQKVGWYCMHGAIQTRCLHAFLPTLPYPHWSVPSWTGSFSFLYLEPFSTKAVPGEGHMCCDDLQEAAVSERHAHSFIQRLPCCAFSLGRLNLFQLVRKC